MKAPNQLFIIAFCWTIISFQANAQDGPCMLLGPSETVCPAPGGTLNASSNAINLHLADITAGLDASLSAAVQPRYKAFWIFGDGNFRYFQPNLEYAADIATLNVTYGYPTRQAEYVANVVLTEKKSNTTPPPAVWRQIGISPLNPKNPVWDPTDAFQYRIGPAQTMDIFNSELNRPKYPTAFVVSAPKNDDRITKMLFFFNSMRFGTTGPFRAGTLHDPNHDFSIHMPNYLPSQTPAISAVADFNQSAAFNSDFVNGLSLFEHYIEVDIPNDARNIMPSGFTEMRFFPVLKTLWDDNWLTDTNNDGQPDTLLPYARYLSVALGPEPLFTDKSPDSPELNNFQHVVSTFFDGLKGPEYQVSADPPLYIRGIDTLDVRMVASIDPNGIQVLKVCPIGKDKYQVRLRLEVCNDGYMHESNFRFRLIDHSQLLSEPNFSGDPLIISQTFTPPPVHEWAYLWNTFLDGVPLPGTTVTGPVHNCAQTEFMVETNWAGVQALIDGKALELCVQFSLGWPVCTYNSPVSSQAYCPEAGYNCGDCPKVAAQDSCCYWYGYGIALLGLILLALLWLLWLVWRRLNHP